MIDIRLAFYEYMTAQARVRLVRIIDMRIGTTL